MVCFVSTKFASFQNQLWLPTSLPCLVFLLQWGQTFYEVGLFFLKFIYSEKAKKSGAFFSYLWRYVKTHMDRHRQFHEIFFEASSLANLFIVPAIFKCILPKFMLFQKVFGPIVYAKTFPRRCRSSCKWGADGHGHAFPQIAISLKSHL
jgi:hypothetical protein